MGINFPNSPTVGQQWPSPPVAGIPVYQWDGEKWMAGPPGLPDGLHHYDIAQSLTAPQLILARQNIFAAPYDAMQYNGMQVNGTGEISQDVGGAGVNITGGGSYIADNWFGAGSRSGATFNGGQTSSGIQFGFNSSVYNQISGGPFTTFGSGEYVLTQHKIEGLRCRRLAWGTVNAVPIAISFWAYSVVAGTATLTIRNSAANLTYYKNFTFAANTWTFVSFVVPGPTTGTWLIDTGIGMTLTWCWGAGATLNGGLDNGTWQTGASQLATSSVSTNLFGTGGNACHVTGLHVVPGNEGPSAANSSFVQRPLDQELLLTSRYMATGQFPITYAGGGYAAGITSAYGQVIMPVPMRTSPTMSWSASYYSGGSGAGFTPAILGGSNQAVNFSGTGLTNWQGWAGGSWKAYARL